MLRTPVILGMSMAPQKNRRLLVVATYLILAACVAAILVAPPLVGRMRLMWLLFLPLAYNVVSYEVFGKLIRPIALPQPRREMTSLGLTPRRRDQDEPDERELVVRNAAHYHAFRAAAVYGLVLWWSMPLLWHWDFRGATVVLIVLLLAMPLLTILFTLPQAIILWTEPDVPEEARV
jgi:hypothetical protein